MRAISITVVLMFRLKVLIKSIKVKVDIIKISNCTLYIVKLFTVFDILASVSLWPLLVIEFVPRAVPACLIIR